MVTIKAPDSPSPRLDTAVVAAAGSATATVGIARAARRKRVARIAEILSSAAFAAVLGGLLIGMALPRLIGSIILAPQDDVVTRLAAGAKVSTADLGAAEASRRRALAVLESGWTWTELGAIYFERARRLAPRHHGHGVYLSRSIGALKRGLAIAPAQPFAWTMLAQAALARDGAGPSVAQSLRMAIQTAPVSPSLVIPRIEIALASWAALDSETRDLVASQMFLAVDRAPVQLAKLARRRYELRRVRDILAADPTRLRRFDTVYLTAD